MMADRAQFFENQQQSEAFAQQFVELAEQYPRRNVSVSLHLDPGVSRAKRWLQLCFRSSKGAVLVSEPMCCSTTPEQLLALIKRHLQAFAAC